MPSSALHAQLSRFRMDAVFEKAWLLPLTDIRDINRLLRPTGALVEGAPSEGIERLFDSMMECDEIDARIVAMVWCLAAQVDGNTRPNPSKVRLIWARLIVLEAVLGGLNDDQLRAIDVVALRDELRPLDLLLPSIRIFSERRAPTGEHLRAIISGRLIAISDSIRYLPSHEREGVSRLRRALVPEALAAIITGKRRRLSVTSGLVRFGMHQVAALVRDGPEMLSEEEVVELADYGFNRHGRYNGDRAIERSQ